MRVEDKSGVEPVSRDPIEWAIIGIVLGGASLVLAIRNKIDARRDAESAKRARQAEASNRLRLNAINLHLGDIEAFISHTRERSKVVVDEKAKGIARRSIVFATADAEERFNHEFDQAAGAIGRINRLLSELDVDGFPLKPKDVEDFVTVPLGRIQENAASVLRSDDDRVDRLEAALAVVSDCRIFVRNLERALSDRSS